MGASGHWRISRLLELRPAPRTAGAFHRMRLRPAKGSPPSASTSLTGGGGPSTPAAGVPGMAHRLAAYARQAAAKKGDHHRANAAETTPRVRGVLTAEQRSPFSSCLPTSSARTTNAQRESGRRSSGYVRSLARRAKPSCIPPHKPTPLASASFLRSSPGTLPMLRSRTKVCMATTRHARAAARSAPCHLHCAETSSNGIRERLRSNTRKEAGSRTSSGHAGSIRKAWAQHGLDCDKRMLRQGGHCVHERVANLRKQTHPLQGWCPCG